MDFGMNIDVTIAHIIRDDIVRVPGAKDASIRSLQLFVCNGFEIKSLSGHGFVCVRYFGSGFIYVGGE